MGDIHKAVDFMFGYGEIEELYNDIVKLNDERKTLEKSIMEDVSKMSFDNDLMVVMNIENLGGLGGTIASKVVDKFRKPCILLNGTGDILHGSARSYAGLDLHELFSLAVKAGVMEDFGGHKIAAGVKVRKDKVEDLKDFLNKTIAKYFTLLAEETDVNQEQIIEVDDIIQLSNINKKTVEPYNDLLCFGDLKEPIFAIKNLEVISYNSSSNNPNHLCLNVCDSSIKKIKNRYGKTVGKELWMWNRMNDYKLIGEPNKVHLLGKIIPDFRNPKYYTFDVIEIIPA